MSKGVPANPYINGQLLTYGMTYSWQKMTRQNLFILMSFGCSSYNLLRKMDYILYPMSKK